MKQAPHNWTAGGVLWYGIAQLECSELGSAVFVHWFPHQFWRWGYDMLLLQLPLWHTMGCWTFSWLFFCVFPKNTIQYIEVDMEHPPYVPSDNQTWQAGKSTFSSMIVPAIKWKPPWLVCWFSYPRWMTPKGRAGTNQRSRTGLLVCLHKSWGVGLKLWVPWSKLHRNHTVFFSSSQPIPKLHTFWGHQTWLLRGFSKAFQSPGTKFEVYSISGKIIGHWGFLLLQWDGREATLKKLPVMGIDSQTRWIYGGVDCHDQWPLQETDWLEVTDSIYKSYFFREYPQKNLAWKNGTFYVPPSVGSWISHWRDVVSYCPLVTGQGNPQFPALKYDAYPWLVVHDGGER